MPYNSLSSDIFDKDRNLRIFVDAILCAKCSFQNGVGGLLGFDRNLVVQRGEHFSTTNWYGNLGVGKAKSAPPCMLTFWVFWSLLFRIFQYVSYFF